MANQDNTAGDHTGIWWEENNDLKNYANQYISPVNSTIHKKQAIFLLHFCNKSEKCCFFSQNGVAIATNLAMMLVHKPDGTWFQATKIANLAGLYPKHNI